MRKYIILILVFTICSCKSLKTNQYSNEYVIVNLTLKQYNDIPVFRLLQQPDNHMADNYKNGIIDDSLRFSRTGFKLGDFISEKWTKGIALNNKSISNKLEIIEDYSKVQKLNLVDYEKAQRFISLSNVLYSEDGKYAAITINFFGNFKAGDDSAEGYTLIFENINDNWKFITKITAYIS